MKVALLTFFLLFITANVWAQSAQLNVTIGSSSNTTTTGGSSGGGGVSGGGGILPSYASVTFIGQTQPGVSVVVVKDGQLLLVKDADSQGGFRINVSGLAGGDYLFTLFAKDRSGAKSRPITFVVTVSPALLTEVKDILLIFDKNLFPAVCPIRGDLNNDCHVDLVDFSIAAFWWRKSLGQEFINREKESLNGDGVVDLVDFSIMAYYWTG